MSSSSKAPKGLKDAECEKGKLAIQPPIPYVPPKDLLQTKESSDTLKVKFPDGTIFTMQIFTRGNPEEYLMHIQAVLRLIRNKGLDLLCKKLVREQNEQVTVLEALAKESIGPEDSNSDKAHDTHTLEVKTAWEIHDQKKKQYEEAVASVYELLPNLLAGEAQSQWDCILREMHNCDSWAGLDGKRHDKKRLKTWEAFKECLELHKLTVFSHDAAERQRCYI